jgi:hypothetical protein
LSAFMSLPGRENTCNSNRSNELQRSSNQCVISRNNRAGALQRCIGRIWETNERVGRRLDVMASISQTGSFKSLVF